jgi:hypothetical protein
MRVGWLAPTKGRVGTWGASRSLALLVVSRDMVHAHRVKDKEEGKADSEAAKREAKRKQRLERAAKRDLSLLSFGDEAEDNEMLAGRAPRGWSGGGKGRAERMWG